MGLRKLFNYPTKEQSLMIARGCDKLAALASAKSSKYSEDESTYKNNTDNKCPNCGGKKIVNKIARVEGRGSVSGSFFLGGGSLYGSSRTDTNGVNHCNDCGNQWKKYERNFKWTDDFIADWINDLNAVKEGKVIYDEKEVLSLLKDIPAESIW